MFTQISSNNPMLEVRIPPDKCTVLNIAVTYHGKQRQYILPPKDPSDRFKVLNTADYGISTNQSTSGYHKFHTTADFFVPLGIAYEDNSSLYTTDENFLLADKLPPDKKLSSSSELRYLRRRIPPDKTSDTEMNHSSFTPNTFVVFKEKYSFHNLPGTFISYKENYPLGSIIPPNNTDHGETLQPKKCVGDKSSPNFKKLGHHNYVKDTTSQCVSRKQSYCRLCGTSMYEVFKYSYDE